MNKNMTYEESRQLIAIENLTLLHTTAKAWKVKFSQDPEEGPTYWLPISQIPDVDGTDLRKVGDTGFVRIPKWLAAEKGFKID